MPIDPRFKPEPFDPRFQGIKKISDRSGNSLLQARVNENRAGNSYLKKIEYYGNRALISATGANTLMIVGDACSMRFTARNSQSITEARCYIHSKSGTVYIKLGIQADSGGLPSGSWLGYQELTGPVTGWNSASFSSVNLTAGTVYHVVAEISYTSGSVSIGIRYSTPHHKLRTYDSTPDDNLNYLTKSLSIWTTRNKQPIFIISGGTSDEGNPYAEYVERKIYGLQWEGEKFTYEEATRGHLTLGFYLKKIGTPSGINVLYYIKNSNFENIESGIFCLVDDVSAGWSWIEKTLSSVLNLVNGQSYYVYLECSLANSSNCIVALSSRTGNESVYYNRSFYAQNALRSYSTDGGSSHAEEGVEDNCFRLQKIANFASDRAGNSALKRFSDRTGNSFLKHRSDDKVGNSYLSNLYLISGYVKDRDDEAVEGVTVDLSGDISDSTETDPYGFYSFSLPSGNYIVKPQYKNWLFDPTTYSYEPLSSDQTNQNFVMDGTSWWKSHEGTAQGGGSDYIDLALDASTEDGFYKKCTVEVLEGPGSGEGAKEITVYTGSSRRANVSPTWTTPPTSASKYKVTSCYNVRARITFGTDHDQIPQGFTFEMPMRTGKAVKIADNAVLNEGIMDWAAYDIAEQSNHNLWAAYLAKVGGDYKIYVVKYDYSQDQWGTPYEVVSVGSTFDTHKGPSIYADNNDILHLGYGCHASNLQYKKSNNTNPGSSSDWSTAQSIATGATYPRIVIDNQNRIYVFYRGPDEYKMSYVRSTDGGSNWGGVQTIINLTAYQRCYAGGVCIDNNVIHVAFCPYTSPGSRGMGYLKGEINAGTGNITWRKADGTEIPEIDLPIDFDTEDEVLAVEVATPPPYVGTNYQVIAVDNSGVAWFGYARQATLYAENLEWVIAHWGGSSWIKETMTTVDGFRGRLSMGGALFINKSNDYKYLFYQVFPPVHEGTAAGGAAGYIDLDSGASANDDFYNDMRIYIQSGTGAGQDRAIKDYAGSNKRAYPDTNFDTAPDATSVFCIYRQWFGNEVGYWKKEGSSWEFELLTYTTQAGHGFLSGKPGFNSITGKAVVFCRLRDVIFQKDPTPELNRADGEDLRIVWGGQEIDRVPSLLNYKSTIFFFKAQNSVPANKSFDQEGEYEIYYDCDEPADYALKDPNQCFSNLISFEKFQEWTDLDGKDGWAKEGTADIKVRDLDNVGRNKVTQGFKALEIYGAGTSLRKIKKNVGTDLTSMEITAWLWLESGFGHLFLELKDLTGDKVFRVALNGSYFSYYDTDWHTTSVVAASNQYHKVKIIINSNGCSAWGDDQLLVSDNPNITVFDEVAFGLDDYGKIYADSLQIKKWLSNPPEISEPLIIGVTSDKSCHSLLKITSTADRVGNSNLKMVIASDRAGNSLLWKTIDSDRGGNSLLKVSKVTDRNGNSLLKATLYSDRGGNSLLWKTIDSDNIGNSLLQKTIAADGSGNSLLKSSKSDDLIGQSLLKEKKVSDNSGNSLLWKTIAADKTGYSLLKKEKDQDVIGNSLLWNKIQSDRQGNSLLKIVFGQQVVGNSLLKETKTGDREGRSLLSENKDSDRSGNSLLKKIYSSDRIGNSLLWKVIVSDTQGNSLLYLTFDSDRSGNSLLKVTSQSDRIGNSCLWKTITDDRQGQSLLKGRQLSDLGGNSLLLKQGIASDLSGDSLLKVTNESDQKGNSWLIFRNSEDKTGNSLLQKTVTSNRRGNSLLGESKVSDRDGNSLLTKTISGNLIGNSLLKSVNRIGDIAGNTLLKKKITEDVHGNSLIKETEESDRSGNSLLKITTGVQKQGNSLLWKIITGDRSGNSLLKVKKSDVFAGNSLLKEKLVQDLAGNSSLKNISTADRQGQSLLSKTKSQQKQGNSLLGGVIAQDVSGNSLLKIRYADDFAGNSLLLKAIASDRQGQSSLRKTTVSDRAGNSSLASSRHSDKQGNSLLSIVYYFDEAGNSLLKVPGIDQDIPGNSLLRKTLAYDRIGNSLLGAARVTDVSGNSCLRKTLAHSDPGNSLIKTVGINNDVAGNSLLKKTGYQDRDGNSYLRGKQTADRQGNSSLQKTIGQDRSGNSYLAFHHTEDRSGNSLLKIPNQSDAAGNSYLFKPTKLDLHGNSLLKMTRDSDCAGNSMLKASGIEDVQGNSYVRPIYEYVDIDFEIVEVIDLSFEVMDEVRIAFKT